MNALRAFEAAARLGSFAAAAAELSVTAGAVSQQIKVMEDWAGVSLFERRAQGVRLTDAGRRLQPSLRQAFDRIGDAARLLREISPRDAITIAALPSVAQLWLQPRLRAVRQALPGVKISIYALDTPPDMRRTLFDFSVYVRKPTGDAREIVLRQDELLPVCAPDVAARLRAGGTLDDETLLRDEAWLDDWEDWAAATGHTLPEAAQSPRYSLYAMAVADAKAGAGVLIGHTCLVDDELAAGTLVAPYEPAVASDKALVVQLPAAAEPPAPVARVVELLRAG